jgi:hypothetical protein
MGEKARRRLGIEPNRDRFVDVDDCVVPAAAGSGFTTRVSPEG